jgi:hypothetical protein
MSQIPPVTSDLLEITVRSKVNELIEQVDTELVKHREEAATQRRVAGISFLLGICLFVVFGLINLF